jgi:hypothetical protein
MTAVVPNNPGNVRLPAVPGASLKEGVDARSGPLRQRQAGAFEESRVEIEE